MSAVYRSEKVGKTGAEGQRLKEAQNINKVTFMISPHLKHILFVRQIPFKLLYLFLQSLLALGNVIFARSAPRQVCRSPSYTIYLFTYLFIGNFHAWRRQSMCLIEILN